MPSDWQCPGNWPWPPAQYFLTGSLAMPQLASHRLHHWAFGVCQYLCRGWAISRHSWTTYQQWDYPKQTLRSFSASKSTRPWWRSRCCRPLAVGRCLHRRWHFARLVGPHSVWLVSLFFDQLRTRECMARRNRRPAEVAWCLSASFGAFLTILSRPPASMKNVGNRRSRWILVSQ